MAKSARRFLPEFQRNQKAGVMMTELKLRMLAQAFICTPDMVNPC
jgi:hypothetical protein